MNKDELIVQLKKILATGPMFDVRTKDHKWHTGFIDEIGMTQDPNSILLTNRRPELGKTFVGRRISISEILEIKVSSDKDSNIA